MSTPVEIMKKIVIALALIYVIVHTYMTNWQPVLTFISILIISKVFNVLTATAFLGAMLISYISYDLFNMEIMESFESSEDEDEVDDKVDDKVKDKVAKKEVSKKSTSGDVSLDLGETLRDAYAKLTPEQLTSMTNETKELMKTQTQLMKTLEGLTPIVENGMSIIQKFNGKDGEKFGDSSLVDLIKGVKQN
jgi:hypothetical protein|tara:strand:+ start:4777 stop:5352 length:576 start_codon:yes stop_codon:yes gene_type:complete